MKKKLTFALCLLAIPVLAQETPTASAPDWLMQLAASHPWLATLIGVMGLLRLIMKPLIAVIHTVADWTETNKDNEFLAKVEASKAFRWFFWALDYVASVKLPKNKPSTLPLILLCAIVCVAPGCVMWKTDKQTTITTTVLGLELCATDATTQTPKVRFGYVRSVEAVTPVSTNKLYSAPVFATFDNNARNPFSVQQQERFGAGDSLVGAGSNAVSMAIAPPPGPTVSVTASNVMPISVNGQAK